MRPFEPRDDRAVHLARDRAHRLEVTRRGDREAGLDDVDAEAGELVCDLELLGGVQRDARRQLAVAQRGVEDDDPVVVHVACSFSACVTCSFVLGSRLRGRHALFPPKGEEKEKGKPARHAADSVPHCWSSNQTRVLPRSTPQRSARLSTSRRPCPPGAGSSSARIVGSGPPPRSCTVKRVRPSACSTMSRIVSSGPYLTALVTSSETSRVASSTLSGGTNRRASSRAWRGASVDRGSETTVSDISDPRPDTHFSRVDIRGPVARLQPARADGPRLRLANYAW